MGLVKASVWKTRPPGLKCTSAAAPTLQQTVACGFGALSNIWDTKYDDESSLVDTEPHAGFYSSNCHQCALVVPDNHSFDGSLQQSGPVS